IDICNIVDGDVSAEVLADSYEEIIEEGKGLAALHKQIVVKVPCTANGIRAIKSFTDMGIRTNCTLVFSLGQALLAAKAGATYVSPFVGRLDDVSSNGIELVSRIVNVYRYYGYQTQVLAASIRSVQHIIQCLEVGADVVTSPLSSIMALLDHPLTEKGLAIFNKAAKELA
ncbi:MAG: fructose-6-phosphate aldolase, partial [Rikenellaceae bacterium]|nr:fructose-6-phosphate aldolase [Rikenellaceae bacterium]